MCPSYLNLHVVILIPDYSLQKTKAHFTKMAPCHLIIMAYSLKQPFNSFEGIYRLNCIYIKKPCKREGRMRENKAGVKSN
jgi:hypothetical protein